MSSVTPTSRGISLLSVNIFFCVLAGVTVVSRCYTRAMLVKAFGLDDWMMVLATIFFYGYCTSSNLGVRHGTGHHMEDLDKHDIVLAMRYWWLCYLFFSLTMIACKLSFAWFLLRITTQRLHSLIIYVASLCTVFAGLAFFLVTLLQCHPISHYWDKYQAEGHESDSTATCVPMNIIMALAYVYSVSSVLTDFTFAILPAFVIWNLQLEKRAKIAVVFLVSMGCFASTAVVVRCIFLPNFVDPDFLWATTNIAIWSTIEMGLSIVTASLATLRPLIKRIRWKLNLTTRGTNKLSGSNDKRLNRCRRSAMDPKPPPKDRSYGTDNSCEEAIYITKDIVLADSVSARSEDVGLGVHSTVYAQRQGSAC
ncbi:hypothetical protein E4U09_006201 [Claviceps aff. purpurea]|uniref:Rhodopsin domain-containing protein n=1 Tax=Claviceps aff. purpurea TaxID=1967640 RepID=A0A9P7TZJ3_9HYPO|nr:hypothetical protein E4U09_006201 [Claviceps aff. purpurea]